MKEINHKDEARDRLNIADTQLENYYDDDQDLNLDTDDRAVCLREAEINALAGIGHALLASSRSCK